MLFREWALFRETTILESDTGISPGVRLAEGLTLWFQIQQGPLVPLHREIAFDVTALLLHTYYHVGLI